MPISKTKVQPKTALKRLEATKQVKFDAQEVANILGTDKHTVLHHIRRDTIIAVLDKTKSGKRGYVVSRAKLRDYIELQVAAS